MKNHSNSNIWLKIGSVLFVLWGILHIWVGYNATCLLINDNPYHELWDMLLGGKNAPIEKFQFATDSITQKVQINFIYNFCLDVTGAGLLGVVIGFMLWRHMIPWLAFFMGFFVIGLIDLSFMFFKLQVVMLKELGRPMAGQSYGFWPS